MPLTNQTVLAPGDGDDDFKHEPLPHPFTHVRLLEILPVTDERDATIRCRVRCVRLTDYDQCYTAISYTWRHNDASCTIDLNGRPVQVKANLHEFLCIYRQKLMQRALAVPTVFLWIDALCLDYGNVRERNSQVQIMPNIYQRAKSVLAWLEPFDDAAEVPGGRDGLQRYVRFLGHVRQSLNLPRAFHNDQILLSKYMPTVHPASSEYLIEWGIMLQLCRHRYWSRLWILQENHFAQDLMFMHHDVFWTWADFRAPFVLLWYLTESNLYPHPPP